LIVPYRKAFLPFFSYFLVHWPSFSLFSVSVFLPPSFLDVIRAQDVLLQSTFLNPFCPDPLLVHVASFEGYLVTFLTSSSNSTLNCSAPSSWPSPFTQRGFPHCDLSNEVKQPRPPFAIVIPPLWLCLFMVFPSLPIRSRYTDDSSFFAIPSLVCDLLFSLKATFQTVLLMEIVNYRRSVSLDRLLFLRWDFYSFRRRDFLFFRLAEFFPTKPAGVHALVSLSRLEFISNSFHHS